MSYVTDANLLLYAVNEDSEFHREASAFIEKCAESAEPWCMPWPVINAFIRISTHPSILPRPLSSAHAIGVVNQILELPQGSTAGEESHDFWKLFSGGFLPLAGLLEQASECLAWCRAGLKKMC